MCCSLATVKKNFEAHSAESVALAPQSKPASMGLAPKFFARFFKKVKFFFAQRPVEEAEPARALES
jgi:hypothetical protein